MKTPAGFLFAGGHAGIKLKKRDLGLIVSEVPSAAAGCFTRSRTRAAPVEWCAAHLPSAEARAIVTNSGNANCMTGAAGAATNERMAAAVAGALGISPGAVLTCSTGVIGAQLPVNKIEAAIPGLVADLGRDPMPFAEAIFTTDTCTKVASREVFLGGDRVRVLGVAKGSGMVHPNMATTLAYLLTDAAIEPDCLGALLRAAVDETFNMISVDGATSTNDCVLALANGLADNERLVDPATDAGRKLGGAVLEVCRELARAVAADGEGAQHLLSVKVTQARDRAEARSLAKSVVESNLVKAAFFGTDPNWGRIAAALGQRAAELGLALEQETLTIAIQNVTVLRRGKVVPFDVDALRALLRGEEVFVEVSLERGSAEAVAWGCDLSYDYVRINADYGAVLVDPSGPVRRDQDLDGKTPELKAIALLQALRYIERFRGKRAVIQCAGAALLRSELKERFAADVRLLHAVGLQPILVHGGGPELDRRLGELGVQPAVVDGLRVTDERALRAVEMLVGGVNQDLVAALSRAGAKAVGISGKDGDLVRAKRATSPTGKDLGYVGDVTRVDTELLELLLGRGYIPVIAPLGMGDDGHTYDIDADAVAAEVAIACGAEKLIYLTDIPGILSKEGLLVSELSGEDLEARLSGGAPAGLPRPSSILRALSGGVATVHIIDGRVPHNVVAELFTARGVGTMVRPGAPLEGDGPPDAS